MPSSPPESSSTQALFYKLLHTNSRRKTPLLDRRGNPNLSGWGGRKSSCHSTTPSRLAGTAPSVQEGSFSISTFCFYPIICFFCTFNFACTPPPPPPLISFQDITEPAGLSDFRHHSGATGNKWFPEIMGAGAGFIDFDSDGWQDILLVGGGSWDSTDDVRSLRLFRNNKDDTFSDVTIRAELDNVRAYGFGLAVADYDNDGDDDFALTTLHHNLLFRNDGSAFSEVSSALPDTPTWSTAALFFDADNDGWLDLLVGNYVEWLAKTDRFCTIDRVEKEYCTPELYEGLPLNLYRNELGERFVDVSMESGLDGNRGKTLGLAVLDYNRDGRLDVVAANDTERDLLFENMGNGLFEERGLVAGIAMTRTGKAGAGMGIDVGVIDSTGETTLFVGNFSNEMLSVFQHTRNGSFRDITTASQIGRPTLRPLTFGLFLFDVELDGDLDLFTLNGHVQEGVAKIYENISFAQHPQLFVNDGAGSFEEFASHAPSVWLKKRVGRGAAYADIDNDGDLDILITTNNGPAELWRNDSAGGNTLQLTLEGRSSNRDAIGASVKIVSQNGTQHRQVKSGSSYLSASEKRVTFGLGDASTVDSLIIQWPSGILDTLVDVADGQYVMVEGEHELLPTDAQ